MEEPFVHGRVLINRDQATIDWAPICLVEARKIRMLLMELAMSGHGMEELEKAERNHRLIGFSSAFSRACRFLFVPSFFIMHFRSREEE